MTKKRLEQLLMWAIHSIFYDEFTNCALSTFEAKGLFGNGFVLKLETGEIFKIAITELE